MRIVKGLNKQLNSRLDHTSFQVHFDHISADLNQKRPFVPPYLSTKIAEFFAGTP